MLDHPWLKMPDDYSFRMSDLEYKKYQLKSNIEAVKEENYSKDLHSKNSKLGQFGRPI